MRGNSLPTSCTEVMGVLPTKTGDWKEHLRQEITKGHSPIMNIILESILVSRYP